MSWMLPSVLYAIVNGRLHELDASLCAQRLPEALHSLLPQLCAQQEGVRFGTQQALKNLIHECLDDAMIIFAVSQASMRSSSMPPAQNAVLAVANMLTVRYQDGWVNALSGGWAPMELISQN